MKEVTYILYQFGKNGSVSFNRNANDAKKKRFKYGVVVDNNVSNKYTFSNYCSITEAKRLFKLYGN